jgi:hypothetical protein
VALHEAASLAGHRRRTRPGLETLILKEILDGPQRPGDQVLAKRPPRSRRHQLWTVHGFASLPLRCDSEPQGHVERRFGGQLFLLMVRCLRVLLDCYRCGFLGESCRSDHIIEPLQASALVSLTVGAAGGRSLSAPPAVTANSAGSRCWPGEAASRIARLVTMTTTFPFPRWAMVWGS